MTRRLIRVLASVTIMMCALGCGEGSTPTSPSVTSPVTETFSGQFGVGGGASRTFSAAQAGTVTVTLTDVAPPPGSVIGLGIGIPRSDNSGCSLSQSVASTTGSNPQLTVAVEAGNYCARVYDIGAMTAPVAFSITIVHP